MYMYLYSYLRKSFNPWPLFKYTQPLLKMYSCIDFVKKSFSALAFQFIKFNLYLQGTDFFISLSLLMFAVAVSVAFQ